MSLSDAQELVAWLVGFVVALPFACVGGTAAYYRWRYRAGIYWQEQFERGLFKHG